MAENQAEAERRLPLLLQTPAAVRFVSYEPALGPVDFTKLRRPITGPGSSQPAAPPTYHQVNALNGFAATLDWHNRGAGHDGPKLDWIIAGGESGPKARPSHPDWFRSVRDQCAEASVPFFFKQWGEWITGERDGDAFVWPDGVRQAIRFGCDQGFWDEKQPCIRVGKKAAGRTLDGRLHDDYPRVTEG